MIASLLGKVIRLDNEKFNKDRMMFARVLAEMNTKQGLHDTIAFTNEDDELVSVQVAYDWKPNLCTTLDDKVDEEGFQVVRTRNKGKSPMVEEVQTTTTNYLNTNNGFEHLAEHDTNPPNEVDQGTLEEHTTNEIMRSIRETAKGDES